MIKTHNFGNSTYSNGTSVDYSNFVITVATGFGTYALKIKDWNAFKTKMESILLNEFTKADFLENFESIHKKWQFDSLGNSIITAGKNEKNMLETINSLLGSSISLYKADSDFTTWNRLENENNIVTQKPCN
ncbi:hypothetical protein ABGT15_05745 [Flavobacterium enshiense]|uniref:hypothetical protein n=1 Tax=Flavobacterium enshiense TaxID=1341165 RepID=UPI00345D43A7